MKPATGKVKVASKSGAGGAEASQAFVYGPYNLVPNVEGSFSGGDVLALVFQVYGGGTTTVEYDIFLDGDLAGSWEADTVTGETGGNLVRIQPLEGFPEGDYEIKVTAKNKESGDRLSKSVDFRVE